MEITDFVNLIYKLKEKEMEQKLWEFWLVKWPRMTKDNFISYSEMLEQAKNQQENINKEPEYTTANQGGLF